MSSETKDASATRDERFTDLDRAIARNPEPLKYRRLSFYDGERIVTRDRRHTGRRADALPKGFVAHSTRESFILAVAPPQLRCGFCPGFADAPDHAKGCPRFEPVSAAKANAGIARAYRQYQPQIVTSEGYQPREGTEERDARLLPRDQRVHEDPALASDAEIRACSRLAAGAGVVQ